MKIIRYPERETWPQLLRRPTEDTKEIEPVVREILSAVRAGGDEALRAFTRKFDGADLTKLEVDEDEFDQAETRMPDDLKEAIKRAGSNIEKFHASQSMREHKVETEPGVICWQRSVAIERVGLYIPAGTAPLFSTVLMLAVPAKLAGCGEIIVCTPPDPDGKVADAVLFAARLCGVTRVFKVGGAQAIAALAYGTETIPRVYKIFGPGNQFVTCAKQLVSTEVAIDMPAGPSEVAVVADDSCVPEFVASDLLAQAEHGPDSQVLLISTSAAVIDKTLAAVGKQIEELPRRDVARAALFNSKAVLVGELRDAIDLVNEYAPEHLILAVENADAIAEKVVNAGSVFIGNYSCESAGDYASGTNHTLPTGGFAKGFSGVSLDSFLKKITFQKLTPEGIRNLGPTIERMAEAEGLRAHKRAVSLRLEAADGI